MMDAAHPPLDEQPEIGGVVAVDVDVVAGGGAVVVAVDVVVAVVVAVVDTLIVAVHE
jgi:hypothetical protein